MLRRVWRGVAAGVRGRPGLFAGVAGGVFVLNLLLPVAVLSLARKPVDYFTFNPWLGNLPGYLRSHPDPWPKKLAFLSDMALAWFISNSPVEGVEWGFVIDVPSLARFALTALLFGAYFAVWAAWRDRVRSAGPGVSAGRHAGAAGAVTSVVGFSTGACSVTGCGVPVLPVVGLALTGVSSGMLAFLGQLARVGSAVVLLAVLAGVLWVGWLAGAPATGQNLRGPRRGRWAAAGLVLLGLGSAGSAPAQPAAGARFHVVAATSTADVGSRDGGRSWTAVVTRGRPG